jgi:glutamate synthase domain-containing protein 2/FAD/FMN-containing dehydrogenase/glutamate synthase domain-containing protein 3/ferredoxin/glutamate synthase domain-containing protein 1
VNKKKSKLAWMKSLEALLERHPGLKKIDEPDKLEYYRTDLNVDLPPLIRDLMLKSLPDLILQPTTEDHLLELFAFAREHKIPLTARGAGTWGYGGAVPTRGGIVIDLSLMDTIDVNPGTFQLTVGPGARFLDIQRELERYGLELATIASGKGGTLIGWMATGGMGIGTFRHGPVKNQIVSLRAITPEGTIKDLSADDPEIRYFLSTEGQMGIIVSATLQVSKRPARWYPIVVPFEKSSSAYAFAKEMACHASLKPEDIVVYHSEFIRALGLATDGKPSIENRHLVLVAFPEEKDVREMKAYLAQRQLSPVDEAVANNLWEKRFLPMSIKHLGPSLLASEMILPLDQVASYVEKVNEWGKPLEVTLYPIAHVVNEKEVLFLAMLATDNRKNIFYLDLMLIPMMLRLAVQNYGGKPYGIGIWNTPFLRNLYTPEELKQLVRYKKKVDPAGILNSGKFFATSGRWGSFQKALFQADIFDLGLSTSQWLMFKLLSFFPAKTLRLRTPVVSQKLEGISKDILSCAQCGACVARCPVYRATGDETLTAKGKLLTIKKALEKGELELSKAMSLYFCLRCGRCDDECQVHLKHLSLFEGLEKYLADSENFPIKQVQNFISEVENSPEFQRFLDVVRTGFDQKIREKRNTFPRYRVQINEEHCIHCGTCVDACIYSVRKRGDADPRVILVEDEGLCRGCGSCLERCPQVAAGFPATSVELHPCYLEIDDPYWNAEVVTSIDLEATTGKIPVSGTGQGDPHRGSGNDGIRFGHFHIVGPAQNLLYESTEDAIAIGLGKRPKYLTFRGEDIETPRSRLIRLKTPILIDVMPRDGLITGKEEWWPPLFEAAHQVGTRITMRLEETVSYGPNVVDRIDALTLRLTAGDVRNFLAGAKWPEFLKTHFPDLVEIELDDDLLGHLDEIAPLFPESTVLSAVVRIEKGDVDSGLRPTSFLQKKLESLVLSPFDILCIASDYDPKKGYYLTTDGVPAVHRFLVERKQRHRFSIVGAGGIRSAADAQKTVQRGANGVKIDWPVLLVADPQARQKFVKREKLEIFHEAPVLAKRIANLIRVWNVQVTEVLGASGFKDIKKTVGEENRLVIFDDLEERIYDILHDPSRQERNERVNRERMAREGLMAGTGWRYGQLKEMIQPTLLPHRFYNAKLPPACQRIFDQDHVWPASLISSVGRMAGGDRETLLLKNTEPCGNLGDGFDSMRIRFNQDPDDIPEERLENVSTALQLTPGFRLKTPLIGAGMSIGSIGPGTWRARVLATRALKTQLDTGEGGYPTFYILDSKWNPLELTDRQVILLGRVMEERKLTTVEEVIRRSQKKETLFPEYKEICEILKKYPSSMPVQFVPIVTSEEEPYVSTQLKTGLFGVTKETIRRARRVVIAYSQGAKQGVGGHLLGRKVFGLVSRLRGVPEGVSLISPFPFHNCYSIEDVKAFIDAVRMINRKAAICIKVSPSPDIEFIVSGLARIAKDNAMTIEVWLDGPRGGTGAAPNIIKGQMGMHMEYAIPICHEKLMDSELREHVVFLGSGGIRTWGDIIKGVALGLDGVVLGTGDLVAIGCVRDRNCESGCRSGISTVNPKMQLLRDVELNTRQIINFRAALQAQVVRAIAALGMEDIRQLRGRYQYIEWQSMEERVRSLRHHRLNLSFAPPSGAGENRAAVAEERPLSESTPSPSDCGVAAIVSNRSIPSHVMDLMLDRMANRGMDGVGIWKGGCYPLHLHHYALHLLVKGIFQQDVEAEHLARDLGLHPRKVRQRAREKVLDVRIKIMKEIMDKYFMGLDVDDDDGDLKRCRIPYRRGTQGEEEDFRLFGEKDPGDVFRFFVRVRQQELSRFIQEELLKDPIWPPRLMRYRDLTVDNYRTNTEFLREAEDEYIYRLARKITRENYVDHQQKKVAVLSCGKNSGCWKSDGRHIPWELPEAPVNIIHRRLATGSVVDQMNSHPFAELHTALTHNGETTNYRTMLNRVTQFNLTPLAQTDTAVASLKLHVLSQYLRYPFDALVESFSPTTGWTLSQLPPEIRERFECVQEVELESAPDGPYQYLCGRIDPYRRVIERLDIIDPSLLRPNVAMLYDDGENFVSIICSEKQGSDAGLQELYRLGLIKSNVAPLTFTVNPGMVSRVFYDQEGKITGHEVLDKFGRKINIPHGTFRPPESRSLSPVFNPPSPHFSKGGLGEFIHDRLAKLNFGEFEASLHRLTEDAPPLKAVEELTQIHDHLAGWDTGEKDRGALIHTVREHVNSLLDRVNGGSGMFRVTASEAAKMRQPENKDQVLVVDARGFQPEGIDPLHVLSCFLDHAHRMGWRRFIVYRVEGQRGIGMGMGSGNTSDTVVDVYGSPGEYCGAFNMGGLVRVHGHAQNFTGMVMHSGTLEIHGDVGKVTGYSAKGGTFNILGNVVDRGWVCAVSDPRGPGLEVNIVGTAYEHLCQALMGGSVLLLGLFWGNDGVLRRMDSPYRGGKILAGASAGEIIFFDPEGRLEEAQYKSCRDQPVDQEKWEQIVGRLMNLEKIFGLGLSRKNGHLTATIDGNLQTITPESFRWIRPKGELEGYH